MTEPRGIPGGGGVVVVPDHAGPVIRLDVPSGRGRDDLDELIDELIPDTDERPGWFDVALFAVGVGLLGWGAVGGGPALAVVSGAISAAIGGILPARSALQRGQRARRQRRKAAVLARGVPMRLSDPTCERLVRAYDALFAAASEPGSPGGGAVIAAGHSALLEVASVLRGHTPASPSERDWVLKRAAAVEELTDALRVGRIRAAELDAGVGGDDGPAPAALLQAREELDSVAGFSSLTRLEELTAEVKARYGPG